MNKLSYNKINCRCCQKARELEGIRHKQQVICQLYLFKVDFTVVWNKMEILRGYYYQKCLINLLMLMNIRVGEDYSKNSDGYQKEF